MSTIVSKDSPSRQEPDESSPPVPLPTIAGFDPDEMESYETREHRDLPCVDLLDYLAGGYSRMYRESRDADILRALSCHGSPDLLRENMKRVQAQLEPRQWVSQHAVFSAGLEVGTTFLADRPEIKNLTAACRRFHVIPSSVPQEIAAAVGSLLSWHGPSCSRSRYNSQITPSAFNRLTVLSFDLGLSASSLALIAVQATLANQLVTMDCDAETMKASVALFLRQADTRARGANVLMREWGI